MSLVHLLSAGHVALLYASPYAPTCQGSQLTPPAGTGFCSGPESTSHFHQSLPLSFHHRSIRPLHVLYLHAIYSFPLTPLTQLYPKTFHTSSSTHAPLLGALCLHSVAEGLHKAYQETSKIMYSFHDTSRSLISAH